MTEREFLESLRAQLGALDALIEERLATRNTRAPKGLRVEEIRDYIRAHQPVSRGQMAEHFGVSHPAITRWWHKLEAAGTIEIIRRPAPHGGRPISLARIAKPGSRQERRNDEEAKLPRLYSGAGPSGKRPRGLPEESRKLVRDAAKQGLTVVRSTRHFELVDADGRVLVSIPSTSSSDIRAVKNARAELRRKGVSV